MTIPPIVGVPDFFKCDFGPSSLSVCPTFSLLKKGIRIGAQTALTPNEINIGNKMLTSTMIYAAPDFLNFQYITNLSKQISSYHVSCLNANPCMDYSSIYGRIFSNSTRATGAAICPP